MLGSRVLSVLILGGAGLVLTGCGAVSQGLGSVTSEGLVDEYAIPQNRGLAYPTDFSSLPTPQNPRGVEASLPSQSEIESLMFTLEPEPVEEYVPLTVVTGTVPEYQPIGRIVGSGSSGAAQQATVSAQTTAAGSIYPVYDTAPVVTPASAPVAPVSASSSDAVVVLSPEEAAALSALAIGAPVSAVPPAAPINSAQIITSLPDGVTAVGAPVVLQR